MSNGINKEFDTDLAIEISKIVPLDSHYEAENAFAYSMYIDYGVSTQKSNMKGITAITATFINASGKILFLYCYAPKEELEWTRTASIDWSETIIACNSKPPVKSSDLHGFDWDKVFQKGIGGAITGALAGLVIMGISYYNKRKANR